MIGKQLFNQLIRRRLVYNQCWEDYALDQSALRIGPGDRIVTITSAGCNSLNYLLFDPFRIDAVDLNPHQTALLELKIAAIRKLRYEEFFEMFGSGRISAHRKIYARLRPLLSNGSRKVWDRHINYFDAAGHGLYLSGLSGTFARGVNLYVDSIPGFRRDLEDFQRIDDLKRQAEVYHSKVAPRLWSRGVRWLLNRETTMVLLGVPSAQIQSIQRTGAPKLSSFIEQRLDHLFTRVPIRSNYFWHVYMNGRYSRDFCPPYLREENFNLLRARADRVHTHTMQLAEFLKLGGRCFNVYILLDHMDWMNGNPSALREEWQSILETAMPEARIIFRSGGMSFEVPDFARKQLRFHTELTRSLHQQDRVGTYGSFYFATLASS